MGTGLERRFLKPLVHGHSMILTCPVFSLGSLLIRLNMMVMANIYCEFIKCQGSILGCVIRITL